MCGDLNSRIGEIDDVLSNDNIDLYLDSTCRPRGNPDCSEKALRRQNH